MHPSSIKGNKDNECDKRELAMYVCNVYTAICFLARSFYRGSPIYTLLRRVTSNVICFGWHWRFVGLTIYDCHRARDIVEAILLSSLVQENPSFFVHLHVFF